MGILDSIQSFFFGILLRIDAIVYSFIDWIYQIILLLANGNILNNTEVIDELISRVYIILGVVVLFLVAYSLLRNMVNPDEALKGKESPVKMISNVIISIVLIALIPYIFQFAMGFQSALLTNNTLGKIILGEGYVDNTDDGYDSSYNSASVIKNGGFDISTSVFKAFFQPNSDKGYCTYTSLDSENCDKVTITNARDESGKKVSQDYNEWWGSIYSVKKIGKIAEAKDQVADETINYTFLISTVAGVFVVFVLVSYCIDIAIRLVKLAVFQLFAPVAILSRIMPKEEAKKIFSNWLKATISTYLEVFIRLGILFFAVLIIKLITTNFTSIFNVMAENWGNVNPILLLLAQAFVILGIILFVKQAPEIIKEVTGLDGGKYGKSLMRGLGMMTSVLGGGATAAIRSAASDKGKPLVNRTLRAFGAAGGAAGRGLWHGAKVNKFGDISKAAGTAASNTLSKRGTIEASGGKLKYLAQKRADVVASVKDWAGGTADDLKGLKKVNDNLLKQIGAIKNVAEDYIDKHAHEYFKDEAVQNSYNDLNRKIKEAEARKAQGDTTAAGDLAQYESDLAILNSQYASQRLDILKVKSEDVNLSAEERAKYIQEYNKTRKAMVDGFASTAKTHVGAEKEAAQVEAITTTIGELVKENRSATAIQYATTAAGKAKHDDIDTMSEAALQTDTAKFIKNLKKATEYADIDIQAELDEVNRREERRKSGGGSDK